MKNMIKKLSLITLILVLTLALAACTVDPSDDGSDKKMITVEMSIDFPDSDDADEEDFAGQPGVVYPEDVDDFKMQVEEGSTVMQIIQSYASQTGIEVLIDTTSTPYVTSIDGVAGEGMTGWMFSVNDNENITKGAAEYTPENGDEIEWEFRHF